MEFIRQIVHGYLETHANTSMYILDAGCGDGVQLQALTELPGKGVWGIDYNLLRTRRARQNAPAANIVCGDLLRLPFRQGTFDVVVCSQVIEHIPEDTGLLESLASALRAGGLLILGTPNEGCFMARMRNHFFEPMISKNSDHAHFYTESVIRQKIEAAGFFIAQVMRENWFFPLQKMNHYFSTRRWGIRLMARLNEVIPSQTAGFYFLCAKASG
jgi:2-polyprenyl-3-methyl-5-hydroxy-6-metoxy-1,4-benzoquinol methylase